MAFNNRPIKINQNLIFQPASDESLLDVVDCYDDRLPFDGDGAEPEHYETLGFVSIHELRAEIERGSLYDQTDATYSGFVADLDSAPTDRQVGSDLPLDPIAWTNFEIGDQPGERVHNGW